MSTNELESHRKKIGIVGAGNMGAGIAQKYAAEGCEVIVLDVTEKALARGKASIEKTLEEGVQRRVFTDEKRNSILQRLSFTPDEHVLKDCSLVVEAIFENQDVKKDLFRKLDGVCKPETVFATNTSSFLVTELAEATSRPDRFVGLHYFYHPAKNKLVEVIKGKETSQEAFDFAWKLQESISKIPIASKDAPGFVVNRFFVPWLNESMRIVDEGLADIATVEAAAKNAFQIGMGPFELMNVTGVPITLHAATALADKLGKFYEPCNMIRPIVASKGTWDLTGAPEPSNFQMVEDRLLGVVFMIACQLVFDEQVCTLEDCDLGARIGLRWKKGPFELMNEKGISNAGNCVTALAKFHSGLSMPSELKARSQSNKPFRISHFQTAIEDGVAFITFNRPDAMNALDEEVMKQFKEAIHDMRNNSSVTGIVLGGRGKAFVAGADTKFFVDNINRNNVDRVVSFATEGQALFLEIDRCEKPVACCLDGLTLGGGAELALACDYIVASEKTVIGFPETGIGIYPGLGGTQRLPRRVGTALARWLILSGDVINGKIAHATGLVDALCNSQDMKEVAKNWVLNERPKGTESVKEGIPDGFSELAEVFRQPLEVLLAGNPPIKSEKIEKTLKRIKAKAPLALKEADRLIAAAASLSLQEGLREETSGLHRIFSTKDALEGLSSVGRRRPEFRGE